MYSQMQTVQTAIYQLLTNTAEIADVVNGAIYDTVPSSKTTPETYVVIGTDQAFDHSSKTHSACRVLVEVSVFSRATALVPSKALSDLICRTITEYDFDLSPSHHVYTRFKNSKTQRIKSGALNAIKLQFNILVDTTQTP